MIWPAAITLIKAKVAVAREIAAEAKFASLRRRW
jgi:hypothetical protein